jgi:hypothetical protein
MRVQAQPIVRAAQTVMTRGIPTKRARPFRAPVVDPAPPHVAPLFSDEHHYRRAATGAKLTLPAGTFSTMVRAFAFLTSQADSFSPVAHRKLGITLTPKLEPRRRV